MPQMTSTLGENGPLAFCQEKGLFTNEDQTRVPGRSSVGKSFMSAAAAAAALPSGTAVPL